MAIGLNHSSKVVVGATIFLGLMALLAVDSSAAAQAEVATTRREPAQEPFGRRHLCRACEGREFAGRHREPPGGGELVLNRQGFSFTPRRSTEVPALNIAWARDDPHQLSPIPNRPGCRLARGDAVRWIDSEVRRAAMRVSGQQAAALAGTTVSHAGTSSTYLGRGLTKRTQALRVPLSQAH